MSRRTFISIFVLAVFIKSHRHFFNQYTQTSFAGSKQCCHSVQLSWLTSLVDRGIISILLGMVVLVNSMVATTMGRRGLLDRRGGDARVRVLCEKVPGRPASFLVNRIENLNIVL